MTAVRRVVFGEPRPGGSKLAAVLANVPGASYCNRTGSLSHDRVTDVPFAVPLLGLDFEHPTPLKFVNATPPVNDAWGLFAWHHVQLYVAGAEAAKLDPVEIMAVQLCAAIYDATASVAWDHLVVDPDSITWGIKRDGTRFYVVYRGSDTPFDWLRDATALDPSRTFSHDTLGLLWGGFFIGVEDTWTAAKALMASASEIVFTGHSLGAGRATDAAALAALDILQNK